MVRPPKGTANRSSTPPTMPSHQQVRVLRPIAEKNPNKEIAEQLSVSEETVRGQVRNTLSELGAKDRTQPAMIGVKRGITEL